MGSVYARGNVLWVAFRGADGKRHCASTKLRVGQEHLAREILAKVEATVTVGPVGAPTTPQDTLTAKQALAHYMDSHGKHTKSRRKHEGMERSLVRVLGNRPAAEVRQGDVDRYRRRRTGEGVTEKTACNELSMLRTALRYCWKDDLLSSPPRFSVPVPHCERTRVLWPEEARTLLAAAEFDLRRVLLAMFTMGLRRGEALAMTWEMVNHSAREAVIPAAITKTGRPKRVLFPPRLWDLIQQEPRHEVYVFARRRAGLNGKSPNVTVEPWTVAALQRAFKDLRTQVEAGDLTLHDLRRSMASVAQDRGHSMRAVQDVGGWLDTGTLQRHYAHASRAAQRAVSEDLEAVALKRKPATVGATPQEKTQPDGRVSRWRHRDLNPGHSGYEPLALTN